ncbi:U4/U5/U6 small nuclear ribonucleoprotein prp3, partial [Neolecta irregularis DAH-3]
PLPPPPPPPLTAQANLKKGLAALPKPLPPKKRLELLHGPSDDFADPAKNPFFDPALGHESASQRNRLAKSLRFNLKGKFIVQADAIRQAAKMDDLKKRIAQSTKKAGLEEQLDVSDKAYKRDLPPDIEWWDTQLTTNHTYDDLDYGLAKIHSSDSAITIYVQHPIPIPPVHSGKQIPPRALMLTQREQKKLRRQSRAENFKNISDQRRLGLLPPEKPKVKPSNFMRVLTQEAIKDPTLVEAQMKRDIAERAAKHIQDNQQRKLTPQARREKIAQQLQLDAAKGIRSCAFKIKYLSHGQHKFKVDKTALQLGLTGLVILNPKFNLVVVEAGAKAIKTFKKLMLTRIDWTNTCRTTSIRTNNTLEEGESHEQQDLSANTCDLIWEGELKDRGFKTWRFKSVVSDSGASEALERGNAGHLWLAATKFKDANDYD